MNYDEEQSQELEALQAIFPDEFSLLHLSTDDDESSDEGHEEVNKMKHAFTLRLVPLEAPNAASLDGTGSDIVLSTVWRFTFPATYPEVVPIIELDSCENIDELTQQILVDIANQAAAESVGMPMCYTVITAVQQKLTDMKDTIVDRLQYERDRKYREEEELTRKKLEGTRVTPDTFLVWKERFEEEMMALDNEIKAEVLNRKLTGKEIFVTGKAASTQDELFFEGVDELNLDDIQMDDDDEDEGNE